MDGGELDAALGHHIGRHGAVDTAGDHDGSLAAGAHGHTTRAGQLLGVDIGAKVANLHHNQHFGIVDVHLQVVVVAEDVAAHLAADLGRGVGEGLVRALGVHLKGLGGGQAVAQILHGGLLDGVNILDGHTGAGESGNAEHAGDGVAGLLHIHIIVLGLDEDGGLCLAQGEIPCVAQTIAQIGHQRILKGAAIETL